VAPNRNEITFACNAPRKPHVTSTAPFIVAVHAALKAPQTKDVGRPGCMNCMLLLITSVEMTRAMQRMAT
jgi:hypothetical protein